MKTFSIQYKKLLSNFILQKNQKINSLSESDLSYSYNLHKDLLLYYNKYIPHRLNYFLIRSFPQKDLNLILKIECPTAFSDEKENFDKKNKEIIMISKKLRRAFKIDEKKTCFACSKKEICGFFEKEYIQINENKDISSNENIYNVYISELHFYIHILHLMTISSMSSPLASFSDAINVNQKENNELILETTSHDSRLGILYENINNKFSFSKIPSDSIFQSAKVVTENIYYLLDDIITQNGVYVKTLENEYLSKRNYYKIEEKERLKSEDKTINKGNSNEFDESILIENDPRKVLKLFNEAKNRKEKKILLAKFQKEMNNVSIQWGKYEKIDRLKVNKTYTLDDVKTEKLEVQTSNEKLKSVNETSSNKKTNIKYQNTFIPSKSSIERTNSHPELFSIPKINKQVNLNNQLKITFEREANLKKLSSQANSDDSFSLVKLPGKEIKMTLDYVRKIHPEGEEAYKSNINMLVNEKSVNLSEEVRKNRSKKERKMESIQKLTIEKVEKEVEKVETEKMNIKKRIENKEKEKDEEMKMIEGNEKEKENMEIQVSLSSINSEVISNNIDSVLNAFQRNLNNKKEENEGDVNKYEIVLSKDNIEVLKQKVVNDKTRLSTVKQKEFHIKSKYNQERINEYKANNYYQTMDEGHFQYEKDLDVKRSLKYMKTIKKYKNI